MTPAGADVKRVEGVIFGRVQGVGYRDFVRREADARKLTGYVRNGDDGKTVEFVAEGGEAGLQDFLAAVREGPRFAQVTDLTVSWSEGSGGFARFSVEM